MSCPFVLFPARSLPAGRAVQIPPGRPREPCTGASFARRGAGYTFVMEPGEASAARVESVEREGTQIVADSVGSL